MSNSKIKREFLAACRFALHKETDKYVKNILEIADFSKINNVAPKKCQRLIFVTPYMEMHSGGLTSVLRIAQRLTGFGIDVYFTCPISNDISKMKDNSHYNLATYTAKYIYWTNALNDSFDFVIPVEDIMIYYGRLLHGYLIYFIQDYEPYFNPVGDKYFLSKKAYELGEDIISLGKWNIQEIYRNIDKSNLGNLYSIEFPFESSEYPYKKKNFESLYKKSNINLVVYVKREPKRLCGIILSIIERAYIELKNQGIELNVFYFGLHKIEKPKVGKNLGKISKKEIQMLYDKCDFGLVASMTNISLVPYEMIGSGLPVIEFDDGSFSSFLGKDTAILLKDFDYREFVAKILFYKNNPARLSEVTENGRKKVEALSWDKTSEEFYSILESIVDG